MTEEIIGKTVVINKPSYAIYGTFTDLSNITANIPEEHRSKVTADRDTIAVIVQNMSLGAKINNRVPFSRVDMEQYGQAPFPFLISIVMDPASDDKTYFHIEMRAELNAMMRMLLGRRLREGIDKMTDMIAAAASGNITPEMAEQMKNASL